MGEDLDRALARLGAAAEPPWLIFDDPLQSMDDIHIANFAAQVAVDRVEHHREQQLAGSEHGTQQHPR